MNERRVGQVFGVVILTISSVWLGVLSEIEIRLNQAGIAAVRT